MITKQALYQLNWLGGKEKPYAMYCRVQYRGAIAQLVN